MIKLDLGPYCVRFATFQRWNKIGEESTQRGEDKFPPWQLAIWKLTNLANQTNESDKVIYIFIKKHSFLGGFHITRQGKDRSNETLSGLILISVIYVNYFCYVIFFPNKISDYCTFVFTIKMMLIDIVIMNEIT